MKLNYDCLRELLIELEENLTISEELIFEPLYLDDILSFNSLSKYTKQDIYYSLYTLIEIDFIDGQITYADGGVPYIVVISTINYSGHEFLQSIKSNSTWETVKQKIAPIANLSIPIISQISTNIILSELGIQ